MLNRYVVEGIARDVSAGKRVVVLTQRLNEAREVLACACRTLDPSQVIRSTREQLVMRNGGTLAIASERSVDRIRGLQLDCLVLDEHVHMEAALEAFPALLPVGELVRV